MNRRLTRLAAAVLLAVVTLSSFAPVRAASYDYLVYDDSNWYEAYLQLLALVEQIRIWINQAKRLPVDMANRYRVVSPTWPLYDLAGLRYAQPILNALNVGDLLGTGYRQVVHVLDTPDDILGRLPPELRRRLQVAYGAIELADRVATMGVNQAGAVRVGGNSLLSVIQTMQSDAVSTLDDYHTQTALLNKINGASVLGLRIGEQTNQFLAGAIEQLMVDNTRKRDTEATLMNATIYQWRYGQAYGDDLFRNTAAALDGWRQR
jgi:hypothetical protein